VGEGQRLASLAPYPFFVYENALISALTKQRYWLETGSSNTTIQLLAVSCRSRARLLELGCVLQERYEFFLNLAERGGCICPVPAHDNIKMVLFRQK